MDALPRICVREGVKPGPLRLGEAQAKHLTGARRLRAGDAFLVFSGDGREYRAEIEATARGSVQATVGALTRQEPLPALELEIWCANVRANRMEWAIEKCVETGADIFRPITCERTARGQELSAGRRERWERIAIEAAEQCGRLHLPRIEALTPFADACKRLRGPLVLADPDGGPWSTIAPLLPERGTLTVAIGPEGGFSEGEVAEARAAGTLIASLGPNTLRTETAAAVATALVRTHTAAASGGR